MKRQFLAAIALASGGTLVALALARGAGRDDGTEWVGVERTGTIQTDPATSPLRFAPRKPQTLAEVRALHATRKRDLEAERIERLSTWKGSRINPSTADDPGTAQVREAIANSLSRLDPQTPARLEYFGWCRAQDLAVVGWTGGIVGLERAAGGGWLAEVSFGPVFGSGGHLWTPDHFLEVYEVRGNQIRLVSARPPDRPRPGVLFHD